MNLCIATPLFGNWNADFLLSTCHGHFLSVHQLIRAHSLVFNLHFNQEINKGIGRTDEKLERFARFVAVFKRMKPGRCKVGRNRFRLINHFIIRTLNNFGSECIVGYQFNQIKPLIEKFKRLQIHFRFFVGMDNRVQHILVFLPRFVVVFLLIRVIAEQSFMVDFRQVELIRIVPLSISQNALIRLQGPNLHGYLGILLFS